ncbi:MAG TPA: hypothetical protein V6D07_18900 [Trichocoleus sp.]
MEWAASLRYGGQLVRASECDYDDFKYLKPICPNPLCGEAVHLKAKDSTKRQPYWAHFEVKDEALRNCSERVNRFDDEEIKRRQTKARNQRLKDFQRWFWSIVSQLPLSHIDGEIFEGIVEPHWTLYDNNPSYREYSDQVAQLVAEMLRSDELADDIDRVLSGFFDGEFDYFHKKWSSGETAPQHLLDYVQAFRHQVDRRMQKLITAEAIHFICSNTGIQFLRALNFNAIIPLYQINQGSMLPPAHPTISPFLLNLCRDNAITITGLVPWAIEFEKLGSKSKVSV